MLSITECIKDLKTWEDYITKDAGAIPEGIHMARNYLKSLRTIIEKSEDPELPKKIQEFKEWLQKQEEKDAGLHQSNN